METWLRRTRKELAVSGRISGVAKLLAQDGDADAEEWSSRLRNLLENDAQPTMDFIIRLDGVLARGSKQKKSMAQSSGEQLWLL